MAPIPREEGNVWGRPQTAPGQPPGPLEVQTSSGPPRTSPSTTRARCRWASLRWSGPTATSRPASRTRRWSSTRRSRLPTTSITCWSRARRWRHWQNGKLYMHSGTQSAVQTVASISRWLRLEPVVLITGARAAATQPRHRLGALHDPGVAVEEGWRAGDDAHHARGGAVHRRHPPGGARPRQGGFAKDGRLLAVDMYTIGENSAYEAQGDAGQRQPLRLALCISPRRCARAPSPC